MTYLCPHAAKQFYFISRLVPSSQHHFRFNSRIPGEPGSASSPSAFFFHFFQYRTFENKWCRFLKAKFPFCHPTHSVKTLDETKALTPARENHPLPSSFLDLQPDSWRNGHCSLHTVTLMPVYDDKNSQELTQCLTTMLTSRHSTHNEHSALLITNLYYYHCMAIIQDNLC